MAPLAKVKPVNPVSVPVAVKLPPLATENAPLPKSTVPGVPSEL